MTGVQRGKALRVLFSAGGPILRHGLADEGPEGFLVDRLALAQVDRAAGVSIEAGVEQSGRILERGAPGESQLDLSL